jgi:hypothetical protein
MKLAIDIILLTWFFSFVLCIACRNHENSLLAMIGFSFLGVSSVSLLCIIFMAGFIYVLRTIRK